jgi:hypothetical protein
MLFCYEGNSAEVCLVTICMAILFLVGLVQGHGCAQYELFVQDFVSASLMIVVI